MCCKTTQFSVNAHSEHAELYVKNKQTIGCVHLGHVHVLLMESAYQAIVCIGQESFVLKAKLYICYFIVRCRVIGIYVAVIGHQDIAAAVKG